MSFQMDKIEFQLDVNKILVLDLADFTPSRQFEIHREVHQRLDNPSARDRLFKFKFQR